MPAPRKQSPSSPATDRQAGGPALTRARALHWWRAGYEAGHQAAGHEQQAAAQRDKLTASYRAQLPAHQQAKTDALLLDLIDALASLFTSHDGKA
jgi:hypothetical protein